MTNLEAIDENPAPVGCDICGQQMRLSYVEVLAPDRQLNIFECAPCGATTSTVTSRPTE